MGDRFFDEGHAIDKLNNTICMFSGEPVLVNCLGNGDDKVRITNLKTSVVQDVDYTDSRFDYRAFPLGYLFTNMRTMYLTRMPGRVRSQGLSLGALSPQIGRNTFQSANMYNCITGTHDSFHSVLSKMNESSQIQEMPFHRHASLGRIVKNTYELNYRDNTIAMCDAKGVITPYDILRETQFRSVLRRIGVPQYV